MSTIWGRLRYYLIGVGLGVGIVYFMFGERDFQCSYMPNSRVLKNLRSKTLVFSDLANCQKDCLALDSNDIAQFFVAGVVAFKESDPRKEPCGEYVLFTKLPDEREVRAQVQNCDSTVTLITLIANGTDCQCR